MTDDDDDEYGFEAEDLKFSFELLNSEDGKCITLVCISETELTPDEFAYALKEYARSIEIHLDISESTIIN